MKNRRILVSVIYLVLGAVLFGMGLAETIDAFWSSVGSALLAVGVIQIVQTYRFRKDAAYREKVEVELSDERSQFIRNKAWAWSGYLFILVAAVSTVALKLLGQDLLSMAAGFAVTLIMLLYWICHLVLCRKY